MEATTNTFIRWFTRMRSYPARTGYLCQTNQGRYATLPFSTKHQMFNVSKDNVECAIEVQWWAFLPGASAKGRYRKMSKKEWLQEALAVVLGMGTIFAAVTILLLVR